MNLSYYDILNVKETASTNMIKEAYHTLIKQHHPDKQKHHQSDCKGTTCTAADTSSSISSLDEVRSISMIQRSDRSSSSCCSSTFLQIQSAWECLRDPQLRRQYDHERHKLQHRQQQQQQETYHRQRRRQQNSIPIGIDDCHLVPNPQQEQCEDGIQPDESIQHKHSSIVYMDWIYQCRCGYEIYVAQQQEHQPNQCIDSIELKGNRQTLIPFTAEFTGDSDTWQQDDTMLVQCIGCSSIYDVRPLFVKEDFVKVEETF
jgi:curved DNA-binding protein CbpA